MLNNFRTHLGPDPTGDSHASYFPEIVQQHMLCKTWTKAGQSSNNSVAHRIVSKTSEIVQHWQDNSWRLLAHPGQRELYKTISKDFLGRQDKRPPSECVVARFKNPQKLFEQYFCPGSAFREGCRTISDVFGGRVGHLKKPQKLFTKCTVW